MSQDERAPDPATRTEGEGETLDMPEGLGTFAPGQVLGERYQILEMLGRGGMGEVWHAFDLKLRVEVALKALRSDFFKSERRLELLRQEVRAAREVMSPNVCRIFDLIEIEGRELVSMEYVDGATLLGVLQERGPLELKEAQDIASQFLAGLEAIHKVGLVHRDIKPENIMLTRAGRVVVMDFGLARQEAEGGGSVSGTPAYMPPEQAAGQTLDARADVYAAGVVLAEMVSPEGIKNLQSRQSLWEGVRSEPAQVPDSPWAPALKKAVAKNREQRYNSAHTLTRALEDVTLRVEGADDLHPYPGLASFTEDDAEYFFGREAEVEQMWRKLDRPHLMAVVGPSGAGKTSFLRAGLIPSAGPDWGVLRCTPGNSPFAGLGQALAREMAGDVEAVELLALGHEPDALLGVVSKWKQRHAHALLIVDQFEELFTHSPADEHRRFTKLMMRMALEADVFVLLSMRDDFLLRCREHDALTPVFTDLTALLPPTGAALRRAMVQPATKCGYRFEDDELVEQMLAEVEGERGALPLLAFALARLWEMRDRDSGLLTRQAYRDIGGVGGALARHAEATIDRIGTEHIAIVRELFRNLVTAEGTRAVREWDELLSIFSDSSGESPEEVLRTLIDARLLTSYEIREEDQEPTRRVEIIHESLLANWPRLVRWQTQDADAVQLRDQLRQAARTWDEQGRTDDTLWTGSAYREFALWREQYPGGLTHVEEAFAAAMRSLATRRRRRRRIAVAGTLVLTVMVAAVFAALWRRSTYETRRAEAAKLVALAQVQLDTDPTEALAYATTSLELADTYEARIFVMRALWAGPPAMVADPDLGTNLCVPTFSPDGEWISFAGAARPEVLVWSARGGSPIVLDGHAVSATSPIRTAWSRENLLVTGHRIEGRARVWAMPEARLVREIDLGGTGYWQIAEDSLLAALGGTDPRTDHRTYRLRSWGLRDGEPEELGEIDWTALGGHNFMFDPGGSGFIYSKGDSVYTRPLPIRAGEPDKVLARHSSDGIGVWHWRRPQGLYSRDSGGEIILWTTAIGDPEPGQPLRNPVTASTRLRPEPSGRWAVNTTSNNALLWDLDGLVGARPIELRRSGSWYFSQIDIHPNREWVVASTHGTEELSIWPIDAKLSAVVEGYDSSLRRPVEFTPDGRYLVTNWGQDRVRLWPLPGSGGQDVVDLDLPRPSTRMGLAIEPTGDRVLSVGSGGSIFLLSRSGKEPRRFEGIPGGDFFEEGAFSPSGRLVAVAPMTPSGTDFGQLRIWDVEEGEVKTFELPQPKTKLEGSAFQSYLIYNIAFRDESTLYTAGANGLLRWDLETGVYEVFAEPAPGNMILMSLTEDREKMVSFEVDSSFRRGPVILHDLSTGTQKALSTTGEFEVFRVDAKGELWFSGEENGLIWVGRVDGGAPHLLAGHEARVEDIAISPDGLWIASSSEDNTLRLWPMPDLSKPPLHTLPHDELIAKLHSLTNIRVVRDEGSSTGWKVEVGPFPGWAEVPTW